MLVFGKTALGRQLGYVVCVSIDLPISPLSCVRLAPLLRYSLKT